jgi:uncharacterized protein (DUF2141 family)
MQQLDGLRCVTAVYRSIWLFIAEFLDNACQPCMRILSWIHFLGSSNNHCFLDHTQKENFMNQYKSIIRILLISAVAAIVCAGNGMAGDKGRLVVDITGIPAAEGYVMVAVFNSEQAYKGEGEAVAKARINVAGEQVQAVFPDLAYGWYGVAVYHDRNANGELDTGAFGIPKEAYGHSNNVRGNFGPPAFNKIKVELAKDEKHIRIGLK